MFSLQLYDTHIIIKVVGFQTCIHKLSSNIPLFFHQNMTSHFEKINKMNTNIKFNYKIKDDFL